MLAQLVPTARAARADGSCSSSLCDLCMCPDLPPSTVACRCTASWRTVVNGRRFGNNDRATWRTINISIRFPSGDRKGEYLLFLCVTNNLVRRCLSLEHCDFHLVRRCDFHVVWSGGVSNAAISIRKAPSDPPPSSGGLPDDRF